MKKTLISLLVLLFLAVSSVSCLAGQLLPYPKFKATDSIGVPYSGGKLYTYAAGTSTAKAAYTDVNLSTAAANPIILDSSGEAAVYLKGKYKLILKTSADVTVWTLDNVQGMGDWEEGKYYADASETDQGATGSGNSIAAHLATIGSENATIVLANTSGSATTSYTVSTALTIPANVTIQVEPGALIVEGTGSPTVTFNGTLKTSVVIGQIFSGWEAGDIKFASIPEVYADWWYSGSGSYDTPFQCAVQAFSSGPGTVRMLNKTYALVSGFTVNAHRTWIVGQGPNSSIFGFTPTGTGTAVTFQSADAFQLTQCGIRGVGFYGYGTQVKTAIKLVDVDVFTISNIAIGGGGTWTDATYASVGINICGQDMITIEKVDIYASNPIRISDDASSGFDIDHVIIRDTYLVAESTNACVLVDSGVNLSNVSFEGYHGWALGGYGFKWVDTATTAQSYNLSFKNIRWERSTNATGWIIDIEHNYVLYNLLVENVYGGGTGENGIKLSKVVHATLKNHTYNGAASALTVDANTRPVTLENCYYIAGSSVTMTGLTKIFDSGLSNADSIVSALTIYDVPKALSAPGLGNLTTYADNATAVAGGLTAGMLYKTSTGVVMVVY
jgi:hypothetical protein